MKFITRLLIFTFLLSSTITLAQPGREKVEEYELNNKSLFDLANHFNNYLGVLFEEGELSELSKAVSQLDSLGHFVGVNSGYSLLSLVQTRNQAILESSLTNDNIFLAGFVSDKQGGVGLDFYAYIDNTLFSDQENETYSSFIEEEIQRYYNSQLRRVKSAPDAIAYGMGVYLDILLGRNDLAPSYLDGGEPDVGQGIETFKNKQPKTISPYIYFEEETTFMGLAGIPIPLPANAFVTFYPVGHKYEGCLRSFTLDREINATNGTDERGVYKPLTYTSSTPYFGKFAGYGYRILPEGMGVNSAKFKRYSYEEFVQPQETIGLPTYSEGKVINVTRGIVYSCVEGRTSAKYSTKTNNYVITVEDVSDPSINPDYEYVHDRLSYLGVNDFMTAQVIFEGYSASTTTWDNILNQAVSVDQSHDGAGSYSCIVDSLGNETHIKAAIESGQSYITKLRDGSIAIIAVVGGKQYFVYQPFDDQQGAEYMIYHESAGWVDIDVIHDNTVNDFVNAMVYVGETIAIASFIVANIVIGNEVAAGMAIAGYCSSSIVAATVGIDLAFGVAEGGVVLFLTDDPDKAKTAFLVAAGAAIVGGGLEVLAQRAVKSFSKFRFGRQLGEATEGFDAIIKIRRADGTEISRSLRQFTNDLKLDGFSEARIKILFDEMNGNAKFTNFVLSAEGLNGARAWKVVYDVNLPPAIKVELKDVSYYEKISTHLSTQNLNTGDVLASVQGASTTRRKISQLGLDLDDINDLTGSFGHFLHSPGIHGVPESQLISEFTPGANTGFTGVINFRHGEFSMAPSDITDISNSSFTELLPRNAGHAQLAESIFEETEMVAGFALHYVELGKLEVSWLSGMNSRRGYGFAPPGDERMLRPEYRGYILNALGEMYPNTQIIPRP